MLFIKHSNSNKKANNNSDKSDNNIETLLIIYCRLDQALIITVTMYFITMKKKKSFITYYITKP